MTGSPSSASITGTSANWARPGWPQRGNAYRWSFFDPEGRAGIELGVYGVPETFFVAADGTLLAKHVGPLDADSLRGYLKTLFGVS